MDYLSLPLPPPWRERMVLGGVVYENEVTNEVISMHPMQRLLEQRQQRQQQFEQEQQHLKEESEESVYIPVPEEDELLFGERPLRQEQLLEQHQQQQQSEQSQSVVQHQQHSHASLSKFSDFRCYWKELGLFGDTKAYCMLLRFFDDCHAEIKFDGLEGKWTLSHIDGPHGPLDKHDLFIGAKIKVFGRHLTISSSTAAACHWIDHEAKRLKKQQAYLQSKIESVGAVPVVRRPVPTGIKLALRVAKGAGQTDLRRLVNENRKLFEQSCSLGLGGAVVSQANA